MSAVVSFAAVGRKARTSSHPGTGEAGIRDLFARDPGSPLRSGWDDGVGALSCKAGRTRKVAGVLPRLRGRC